MESAAALPELASVYWRRGVDPGTLVRDGRLWAASTTAQVVPFLAFAAFLAVAAPITAPLGLVLVAHAWIVPALYAARGANVVRPKRSAAGPGSQERALGMLADLLDRDAFALFTETGLVLEPGALGTWLVAEAGALLIPPTGGRVHCYCVSVRDSELPAADRIAHLLLALRCDEAGFATVANRAFVGAPWRVRRRMPVAMRPALVAAVRRARDASRAGAVVGSRSAAEQQTRREQRAEGQLQHAGLGQRLVERRAVGMGAHEPDERHGEAEGQPRQQHPGRHRAEQPGDRRE